MQRSLRLCCTDKLCFPLLAVTTMSLAPNSPTPPDDSIAPSAATSSPGTPTPVTPTPLATTSSDHTAIITDGPPFIGLDDKRYRRLSYLQCFPCYKYRGKCSYHRPCPRCTDRHMQSHCVDVPPACLPCQTNGAYCDRNRPCKKCRESGVDKEACVDGVEVGRKEEDVEVDEHGQPLPPPVLEAVEEVGVPKEKVGEGGKYRRMTEAEKLQVEMMDGQSNKRRRADDDDDDADRKDDPAQHETATTTMNGTAAAPPPPPVIDIVTVLRNEQWLPPEGDIDTQEQVKLINRRVAAMEAAHHPPSHFDNPTPFIDLLVAQPADELPAASDDFIGDFNHLFPRPPLSSLSSVPTAFLNLWAHFMHKRKQSIVGHSVLLPATSASPLRHITAWDVYRSVVEHGGYHHVVQHALWHRVMRQIVLSSTEWDGKPVRTTAEAAGAGEGDGLTGGPPVPLSVLKPRSFLTEYYEKFLFLFEWTYQWRKGSTHPSLEEGEKDKKRRVKRPKTALSYRNQLLNRLWPIEVAKAVHDSGRQARLSETDEGGQTDVAAREPAEVLGYIGMQRLKRSLQSTVTDEVVWAVNRLLVLSERVARKRGGWEEKEVDDDDDSSDCNLLFVYELLDDLLRLLLYAPLIRTTISAAHPALTPLLLTAHINTLVSSTPALALSSAVVTILNNLSLYYGNMRRLAANTTLVNMLVDVCSTASVWRGEEEERAVLWGVLMRLMSAVDLRVVVRRQQLLASIIERLRQYLDTALFPLVGVGESEEVEEDELAGASGEEAEEAVRGLLNLLASPHFSVNVPYLEASLPPSLFALLVILASPLTPSTSLRLLCCQSLAFFCLSSGAFVTPIVAGRGLRTLVASLQSTDESDDGKELRRTCAAAVQAIVSWCVIPGKAGSGSGSGGGVRDPWIWREVKQQEELLAAACFRDADVNALLRHVLHTIEKERAAGKQKAAATVSH